MDTLLQTIKHAIITQVTTPARATCFFKTEPGGYAAHDKFIGAPVPALRKISKTFANTNFSVLKQLLHSPFNEERLLALFILVQQYQKADTLLQTTIYQFYLDNLHYVNNWNLVDASAHLILGAHLWDKDCAVLEKLARSKVLWERRIAIVATWYFIRKGELELTFHMTKSLLEDKHDLIHKATGWMLREAGKRDEIALIEFLKEHADKMPRTMLRYAIEKLTPEKRQFFLSLGKVAKR